ncbi:MAG: amidase [Rhizobiaceae bacterium]
MTTQEALVVRSLSAGYGRIPVLRGVDLTVLQGEIVGILGHNGMGKSTLLKAIMGVIPATGGSVTLAGDTITSLPPHLRSQRGIGYVPQGRGIFPKLSVRENLRIAWHGYDGESEESAVQNALRDFPRIERLLDRPGGSLSGGEQQLLALARCLVGDPWLLLLDEPTEGIQPSIIEELEDTLVRLRRERGLTILLVEQNFDFIAALSDRVVVLERGAFTGELDARQLADPAQVDAFLGLGGARRTRSAHAAEAATQMGRVHDLPPATPVFDGHQRQPVAAAIHAAPAPQHFPEPAARRPAQPVSDGNSARAHAMTVKRPTMQQMRDMSEAMGFSMSDGDLASYLSVMEPYIQGYDRINSEPDFLPEVRYPRSPGYRPAASENQLNAWYYKTDIRGAASGPLAGKRIVVKDTVCVAGVPMMNGSSIMEGYTPEIDATIVTRMLDAGGIIAGKSTCENLCLSGASHTSATGPVHNPFKRGYMAGGSSSGSAVLVATGEVDMAIAGDQGGSIRIPSSNCGVYGMKPTHGLVPYTGVMGVEQTIDHVGPVTRNVADNALLLEVLAGGDGLDPRQYKPEVNRYTEAVGRGCRGLRIGILREGFARPESEADVDRKVRAAAECFKGLGAEVEEISIPGHILGADYWTAITVEGLQDGMMHGNTAGSNYRGLFLPSMIDHFAGWRGRADELSSSLKVCMFLGEYFQTRYRGRFYGKSQNLMRRLRSQYEAAFRRYDLLLMPTVPMKPQPIPPFDAPLDLYVRRAFEMVGNTAPFNASGFPAMSVPCGMSEGLPIGMMLVGDNYAETTIYRAASAFEGIGDWRTM